MVMFCRIANAMATSGRHWAEIIAHNNSGTYNNQYMVVDLKLFNPGQELRPNLLWVIEQVSVSPALADYLASAHKCLRHG